MSRVQLALNVDDLEAAIAFYSKLFDAQPNKVRDGYANFAIAEPPLKLVLIENPGQGGSLNHLGVEVENTDLVTATNDRLRGVGMVTDLEESTTCCFAVQDKVWVHGPDAEPWEVYTVLSDADVMHPVPEATAGCCGVEAAEPVTMGVKPATCC
ncbi:MAG: ArsI/CadI family heavy metal resistance metalloenzyme [Actinomycetota bacterium]